MSHMLRPNKKISVFRVTGLKILGRVGTHIFLLLFFSENLKKNLGYTSKLRWGQVTLNTGMFFIWL